MTQNVQGQSLTQGQGRGRTPDQDQGHMENIQKGEDPIQGKGI